MAERTRVAFYSDLIEEFVADWSPGTSKMTAEQRIEELIRAGEEMAGCLRRNAISDESTDAPFNEDADLALQRWDRLRSTEELEAA